MAVIKPGGVIGILGGGQLGRMTAVAAAEMGYRTHIFCPELDSPATHVASVVTHADYDDYAALEKFANSVDVVTFEFENIPDKAVEALAKHVAVRPHWRALHVAQNRLREKGLMREMGIAVANFEPVQSVQELKDAYRAIGTEKAILKTCELGYDGKGQAIIDAGSDLDSIWSSSGFKDAVLEAFVPFEVEISVVVARDIYGKMVTFPVGENVHKAGILDITTVPANVKKSVAETAENYAKDIAQELEVVGLLAVEFFVTKSGEVLVNEMAPRPHNSGHWTQDGCDTSQFEQFVRAVCGLPLGSVRQHSKVVMHNLIGADVDRWEDIYGGDSAANVHLYGKHESRPGRKMGHVNYISPLSN